MPTHPKEIAFFDRGPVDSTKMDAAAAPGRPTGTTASSSSSEIARGLDIFELTPSGFISQNEIDAAKSVHLDYLNTQGQRQAGLAGELRAGAGLPGSAGAVEGAGGWQDRRGCGRRSAARRRRSGAEQRAALSQLAARLEADVSASKDAAKVRTLAGAVKELSSEPRLAQGR